MSLYYYPFTFPLALLHCSLYSVHDDAKDKPMEIELSWVCEASGWRHQAVPKDIHTGAETWAKAQIEAEERGSDDDDDE